MSGLNKVILFGNLGADPELRFTQTGQPVLHLRLATNETWVDKNKEVQSRVEWHDVTVWGARAEALARFLKKGEALMVEGRLETSSYEKDGVKRWRTSIIAREVCLTGRKAPSMPVEDSHRDEAPSLPKSARNGSPPSLALELTDDLAF